MDELNSPGREIPDGVAARVVHVAHEEQLIPLYGETKATSALRLVPPPAHVRLKDHLRGAEMIRHDGNHRAALERQRTGCVIGKAKRYRAEGSRSRRYLVVASERLAAAIAVERAAVTVVRGHRPSGDQPGGSSVRLVKITAEKQHASLEYLDEITFAGLCGIPPPAGLRLCVDEQEQNKRQPATTSLKSSSQHVRILVMAALPWPGATVMSGRSAVRAAAVQLILTRWNIAATADAGSARLLAISRSW